ncbi:aminoglycoside phosphotransferase family protein [Jannaschia aquimarina]|uniref:Phosphotransferase enzyme family protein n=1 Tax=Jannaschia aquimarina TaxID=935700 RepID=A0A0D1ECJ5_9RHOB|nr:phosphotransferase [Jannaschia aquimarina]KIT15444.1 Phosphotransferase enzyme family protein [Jannaschia aquimarina]SNT22282.1 hypothetical protein SAMN05421775_10836 [Jannaschia aquimarina]
MSDSDRIHGFLARAGLADTPRRPLAGDASARRYERVGHYVLMDAPQGSGEDVRPFVKIAARLEEAGLSVPKVHLADETNGLLLLEDLGDTLYSSHLVRHPGEESLLYATAAGALARLQNVPCGDLPDYVSAMADLACLSVDWYAPGAIPRKTLEAAMAAALADLPEGRVLVHRDFHADNLIWMPDRDGAARVGLLDFQDAMAGPPDYDLASLVRDARRVVSASAEEAAITRYRAISGRGEAEVTRGMAICSAQRNLRILGVFARLCLRDGKTRYVDFIPRTWALLQEDLQHPSLSGLAEAVGELPAPSKARLDALRAGAGRGSP